VAEEKLRPWLVVIWWWGNSKKTKRLVLGVRGSENEDADGKVKGLCGAFADWNGSEPGIDCLGFPDPIRGEPVKQYPGFPGGLPLNPLVASVFHFADGVPSARADLNFVLEETVHPCSTPNACPDTSDVPKRCRVHSGYRQSVMKLVPDIDRWIEKHSTLKVEEICITGYSRGAALATLLGFRCAVLHPGKTISVVVWGSPRLGDARFVHAFRQQKNLHYAGFANSSDIVPHLPPENTIPSKGYKVQTVPELKAWLEAWSHGYFHVDAPVRLDAPFLDMTAMQALNWLCRDGAQALLGDDAATNHHSLQCYENNLLGCFKSPLEIRRDEKIGFAKPFVWKCWGFMLGRDGRKLPTISMELTLLKAQEVNTFLAIADLRADMKRAFHDAKSGIANLAKEAEKSFEDEAAAAFMRDMAEKTYYLIECASAASSAGQASPAATQVEDEQTVDECVEELLCVFYEVMKLLADLLQVHASRNNVVSVFETLLRCMTVLFSYRIQVPPFDKEKEAYFLLNVMGLIDRGMPLLKQFADQWKCNSQRDVEDRLPSIIALDDSLAALSSMMELPGLSMFHPDMLAGSGTPNITSIATTPKILAAFGENLSVVPKHLNGAVTALRACYYDFNVEVPGFTHIRNSVHESAMVFRDVLLPLTKTFMLDVVSFFKNYLVTFESWLQTIDDTTEDAVEYQEKGLSLSAGFKLLRVDFGKAKNQAHVLLQKMQANVSAFEAKALAAKESVSHAAALSRDAHMSNVWLTMFGQIGEYLHVLLTKNKRLAADKLVEESCEKFGVCLDQMDAAVLAMKVIDGTLISSIDGFSDTMTVISEFFTGLQVEMHLFNRAQGKLRKWQQEMLTARMRAHFDMVKASAVKIETNARAFLNMIDTADVEILCLPKLKTDNTTLRGVSQKVRELIGELSPKFEGCSIDPLLKKILALEPGGDIAVVGTDTGGGGGQGG